jgi:hypothetical protein
MSQIFPNFAASNNKTIEIMEIKEIYEKIQREHPNLVESFLDKSSRENEQEQQTIYGDLSDWLRDYYTIIPSADRDVVARLLIGDYVIHHPYCLQRAYMVIQESNVDGEMLFNAVPCTSMEAAKAVLAQEKRTILHESHHFGNLTEDDMEEMEVEEDEQRFYINDPCDDYYEDIRIEVKNIIVK